MKLKSDSVNIWGLDAKMQPALKGIEKVWNTNGHEAVITCARDGMHSAGSFHYFGLAVDVRNRYFTETEKKKVFSEIKQKLGSDFDVIMHKTHIHVEYDPN